MLADRDRIFTNLYGEHDWHLAGARERGDWDGTKELILKGRDWIVNEVQGIGAARARRRRFPDRAQMVVHAEEPATGRPISWSMPTRASPAPARTATSSRNDPHKLIEGCLLAGVAMGVGACLHLYPRRVLQRGAASPGGDRRGLRGRADRQERLRLRLRLRCLSASRRRRLYLRRGDGAARKPRGQEGPAAPEAAVSGGGRALRLPDDGQQRRDDRRRRRRSCGAAPRGSPGSAGPRTPAPRSSASPAT